MSERQEILRSIIADLEAMMLKANVNIPLLEKAKEKLNIGEELSKRGAEEYKSRNQPVSEKENHIRMGIGEIGRPNVIFPRAFRFLLKSKCLPRLEHFVVKVKPHFTGGTLTLEVYEIIDETDFAQSLHDWIFDLASEKLSDELTLTTYDGCGSPLYEMKFTGIKVLDHQLSGFDYSISDTSNQQLLLSFDTVVRKSLVKKKGESDGSCNTSKTN